METQERKVVAQEVVDPASKGDGMHPMEPSEPRQVLSCEPSGKSFTFLEKSVKTFPGQLDARYDSVDPENPEEVLRDGLIPGLLHPQAHGEPKHIRRYYWTPSSTTISRPMGKN